MNETLVELAATLLIKNGIKPEDIWSNERTKELTAFGAIAIVALLTNIAQALAKKVIE